MKNSSAKNQFDKARKGPPNGSNNRAEVAAVLARFAVHELSSALHRKDFRGAVSAGKKVHHAKKKKNLDVVGFLIMESEGVLGLGCNGRIFARLKTDSVEL